jgi:hypothetical protein
MKDKRRHYKVTPTYAVSFDGDLNWTLLELLPEREGKDRETGETKTMPPKEVAISYHATPEDALRAAVRRTAALKDCETISDYLTELNAVMKRVEGILK